jgi:hypothetical protein
MEKTKLTKAQADALEALKEVQQVKKWESNKMRLVDEKLSEGWVSPRFIAANSIPPHDFIKALYIGYEVELTEKEKIQEVWGKGDEKQVGEFLLRPSKEVLHVYRSGIIDTLTALGREDLIPKETKTNGGNDNGN